MNEPLTRYSPLVLLLSAQLLLSACGGETVNATEAAPGAAGSETVVAREAPPVVEVCSTCGTVTSIVNVTEEGDSSGVGAAIGALVGGLAGNQVGGGSGKRIATVAGVVGGAFAGNQLEKNRNSTQLMEVTISMENGGERRIRVYDIGALSTGSRVRVEGDTILPR